MENTEQPTGTAHQAGLNKSKQKRNTLQPKDSAESKKAAVPPLTDEQIHALEQKRISDAFALVEQVKKEQEHAQREAMQKIQAYADSILTPMGLKLGIIMQPIQSAIGLVPLS